MGTLLEAVKVLVFTALTFECGSRAAKSAKNLYKNTAKSVKDAIN